MRLCKLLIDSPLMASRIGGNSARPDPAESFPASTAAIDSHLSGAQSARSRSLPGGRVLCSLVEIHCDGTHSRGHE